MMGKQLINLQDIKDEFSSAGIGSGFIDIKKVLKTLLPKEKQLDVMTRVRDVELDKISTALYHAHNISILQTKRLSKPRKDETGKEYIPPLMSHPELFILQNLSLRLSLDSQSRDELVKTFIAHIAREMEVGIAAAKEEARVKGEV